MEAPEKIYLIRNFTTSTSLNTTNDHRGKYLQEWYKSREKDADIEYTRTDAFIDKMAIWFNNNFKVHDEYGVISDSFDTKEEMFEDFKNYIKGESKVWKKK